MEQLAKDIGEKWLDGRAGCVVDEPLYPTWAKKDRGLHEKCIICGKEIIAIDMVSYVFAYGPTPQDGGHFHVYCETLEKTRAKRRAYEARARAKKSQKTSGVWCRHCGGPVADGSGDCGECR